jgi:hypothetical protein
MDLNSQAASSKNLVDSKSTLVIQNRLCLGFEIRMQI